MPNLEELLAKQLADGEITREEYETHLARLASPSTEGGSVNHAGKRLVGLARNLSNRGALLHLGVVVLLPVMAFMLTPLGSWMSALGAAVGAEQPADGALEVGLALVWFLVAIVFWLASRRIFSQLAPYVSRSHPVQRAIHDVAASDAGRLEWARTLSARHQRGWVSLQAAADHLRLKGGRPFVSFFVVLIVVALGFDATGGLGTADEYARSGNPEGNVPYNNNSPQNLERLQLAAQSDNAEAGYLLSVLHFAGLQVPRDDRRALELAEQAARSHPAARLMLGTRLLHGFDVTQDKARGFSLLKQVVDEAGDGATAKAVRRLGEAYWFGLGVEIDRQAAVRLFERSSGAGDAYAAGYLGEWAAASGNHSSALSHWKRAAAAGLASPQYSLYLIYSTGDRGAPENDPLALEWLARAARQGMPEAQSELGYEFSRGRLVPKDEIEALRWSSRSAARGNSVGMFNSGLFLERLAASTGVDEFLQFAYYYYSLAASKGYKNAVVPRDRTARRLTAAQLAEAQAAAREFETEVRDVSSLELSATGTGFLADIGLVVTNEHVIGECAAVAIQHDGKIVHNVRVLQADADLDLAILEVKAEPAQSVNRAVATFAPGASLGERATVFGFPLATILASAGNLTEGTVSATAGMRDDPTRLQFSSPVQPGNSGGALLDESGRVIGVVQSGLTELVQGRQRITPQNVNFAIKGNKVVEMLVAGGYLPRVTEPAKPLTDRKALAAKAESISVQVLCYRDAIEEGLDRLGQPR